MGDEFLCLHITVGGSLKPRFLIPERKFEFGKSGFEVGWDEEESTYIERHVIASRISARL